MTVSEIMQEIVNNHCEITVYKLLNEYIIHRLKQKEDELDEANATLKVIKKISKDKDVQKMLEEN